MIEITLKKECLSYRLQKNGNENIGKEHLLSIKEHVSHYGKSIFKLFKNVYKFAK